MKPPRSALALRRVTLGLLLLVLLGLAYLVLRPFLASVVWAMILGFTSWPLFERLRGRLPRHPNAAALLMTLALAMAFMLPLLWLGVLLRNELVRALSEAGAHLAGAALHVPKALSDVPVLGTLLQDLLRDATSEQVAARLRASAWSAQAAEQAVALLGGAGRNAAKFGFALLTLFFVYRDGERGLRQAQAVFRHLLGARVDGYLQAAAGMTRAVLWGLLVTALVQGLFAGLGYWWAGLPSPVLLAAVTSLFALAPYGTPMVWGPAALWLLAQGHLGAGAGLLLWGLLVVSWVDNLVRPLVISGTTRVPFLLVVFGVLGGLAAFGLVGLFLGPVLLAVLLAVWREWLEDSRLDAATPDTRAAAPAPEAHTPPSGRDAHEA